MKTSFSNVAVRGIATALPKNILDFHDLDNLYGKEEVEKTIAATGISKARIADEKTCTSDLSVLAATHLMNHLDIKPETIDGIVFVSQTPDYIMPATSTILQDRLNLPRNVVAFDINYGCSGYIYGLYQAAMMVSSGGCSRVLVCSGDTTSKLVNKKDRSLRMVFGDAASATLVEAGEGSMCFAIKTDGSGANNLIVHAGGFREPSTEETAVEKEYGEGNFCSRNNLYMNGLEIMNFAMRTVSPIIEELLEVCGWQKAEVGTFALHQANRFMIDYLRRKLKLNQEAVPIAMAETGNAGPASIPLMLALEHKRLQEQERLEKVIACGFGVGLSWGAVSLDLSRTTILDPVEL